MNKDNKDNTETGLVTQADAPIEWGTREEINALANRLRALMPGELTQAEALTLAQYSAAVDANPFRGEVYAYTDARGKMILVEGYKILVRWARRQCQFYERYERITNDTDTVPADAIAFRCRILRQDAVNDLARLTEAGISNAYEILTTEAVGVVLKAETWSSKHNKPIPPPKGWTWEDVARKRALKNTLNRAYGAPSPREIAHETWMVDDVETSPDDWRQVTLPAEAKDNAQQRERQPVTQTFDQSMADLGFESEPEPATKPPEPKSGKAAEGTKPSLPESPQDASGNGNGKDSPWHGRFDPINMAREKIGYYGDNAFHVIGALKKLEDQGHITWDMEDNALFLKLNAYAKMRADEKAATA